MSCDQYQSQTRFRFTPAPGSDAAMVATAGFRSRLVHPHTSISTESTSSAGSWSRNKRRGNNAQFTNLLRRAGQAGITKPAKRTRSPSQTHEFELFPEGSKGSEASSKSQRETTIELPSSVNVHIKTLPQTHWVRYTAPGAT